MKSRTAAIWMIAAGSLLGSPALGQSVKPEDRNAALKYSTVFYSTSSELFKKAEEANMAVNMAEMGFDAASAPEAYTAAAAMLKENGAVMGALSQAARLAKCDFEIEYEYGIETLLPHLSKMRSSARLLRLDARRLAIEGDPEAAAERLATIVGMAAHLRNDRVVISSLVGAAMLNLALNEAEAQMLAGKLSRDAAAPLLAAVERLDPSDPFALKESLRTEREMMLGWIKRKFQGTDAGAQLMSQESISGMMLTEQHAGASKTIAAMTQAQLHAAVDLVRPYYDRVIAAWDQPDAVAQLEQLAKGVRQGDFGPLGEVFAPDVVRIRQSAIKTEQSIREAVGKLSGE